MEANSLIEMDSYKEAISSIQTISQKALQEMRALIKVWSLRIQ